MKSYVYNEHGQHRFTDFVGYLPDFLKSEPDVVTLMQVMGDYLNNAYRNLDAVEEFEFKVCGRNISEPTIERTVSDLREMMELASTRGDRVLYISAPHNNVRSNTIVGTGEGGRFLTIEYTGKESDVINGASAIGVPVGTADGQVIYVKYTNTSAIRPYYYDKEFNVLRADPAGTSQDPFSDSYNEPDTVIEFSVSDVSKCRKRFGAVVDNNSYIEYYFTAKITNVTRVSSISRVNFNAGGVENKEMVVDYLDTANVDPKSFHVPLRMYDGSLNWHGSYQYGVFYFKDTSGATINSLSDSQNVLLKDPASDPSILTYRVNRVIIGNNLVDAYIDGPVDRFTNSDIYLLDRNTNQVLGHFLISDASAMDMRSDDGSTHVTLIPASGELDTGLFQDVDNIVLAWVPLYFSKAILDYSRGVPLLRWTGNIVIPGTVAGNLDTNVTLYATDIVENTRAIDVSLGATPESTGSDTISYGHTIYLTDISGIQVGDRLYDEYGTIWDGISVITSIKEVTSAEMPTKSLQNRGGVSYAVEMDTKLPFRTAVADMEFSGINIKSGMGTIMDDGVTCTDGYFNVEFEPGDYVVMRAVWVEDDESWRSDVTLNVVDGYDGDSIVLKYAMVPGRTYHVERVRKDDERRCVHFSYIKVTAEGGFVGACRYISGDIFSPKYMLVKSQYGTNALYVMKTDVMPYGEAVLHYGEYMSEGRSVFRCTAESVTIDGITPLIDVDGMTRDISSHYSVGYKKIYNAFMPYGGYVCALPYGSSVSYSGDMAERTLPLYITKIEDHSLKYGWEAREFVNYGTLNNIARRSRSGYAEFYRSGVSDDIVTSDLRDYTDAVIEYPIVKYGVEPYMSIFPTMRLYAVNEKSGIWTVTVQANDHGLADGCLVTIKGVESDDEAFDDFNQDYVGIHVIDSNSFSYEVTRTLADGTLDPSGTTAHGSIGNATITYTRNYIYDVKDITVTATEIDLNIGEAARTFRDGETFVISGVTAVSNDGKTLVSIPDGEYYAYYGDYETTRQTNHVHIKNRGLIPGGSTEVTYICKPGSRVIEYLCDGDLVLCRTGAGAGDGILTETVYKVSKDMWSEVDPDSLYVPFTMFSRHNMFDVSGDNPKVCLGETHQVSTITYEGNGYARVHLRDAYPHFTRANAGYIADQTEVYIEHAYPSYYNGWHTVHTVYGPNEFSISMPYSTKYQDAVSMYNRTITVREGKWYKYDVKSVDWDKHSNKATYITKNTVAAYHRGDADASEDSSLWYVCTTYPHGFSAGDRIVYDTDGMHVANIFGDSDLADKKGGLPMDQVYSVVSDTVYTTKNLPASVSVDMSSVFRGVTLWDSRDGIGALAGEYGIDLYSLGDGTTPVVHRFRAGDVVVALAEHNRAEVSAYVVQEGEWVPVAEKRVVKISDIAIDLKSNPEYDGGVSGEIAPYTYVTYNDVEVGHCNDDIFYRVPRLRVSGFSFTAPHIDNLDTTRLGAAEYDSRSDFSSVAPRTDMDSSFHGVPDMTYPLAEKIERLAYLHDADVIDYELIGYLGRFMGYDITELGDDIMESNIYRTVNEGKRALRETLAHLPQNYALGGTRGGLDALLAAFGIVGKIITKWTNTSDPYGTLIGEGDVQERIEYESITGTRTGSWVPTPHFDIELTLDSNFRNIIANAEEATRLREQIRVFKPINTVFDDIILTLNAKNKVHPHIHSAGGMLTHTDGVVAAYKTFAADSFGGLEDMIWKASDFPEVITCIDAVNEGRNGNKYTVHIADSNGNHISIIDDDRVAAERILSDRSRMFSVEDDGLLTVRAMVDKPGSEKGSRALIGCWKARAVDIRYMDDGLDNCPI